VQAHERNEEDAMTDYKKILLVVDLSEDSEIVGTRAKQIAAA
jgi:hypothetical protein